MQQKERTLSLCDRMNETGEYYAKWNKPGGERQIPYDFTCERNLEIIQLPPVFLLWL